MRVESHKSARAVVLMVLLLPFWIFGCGTTSQRTSSLGNKYRYYVRLSSPIKSDTMLFRDDRLIIQFRFDDPAIRFQAQNLSDQPMQFDWARARLDLGGRPQAVRTLATYYDTSLVSDSIAAIQPLGVVRDVIAFRSGVTARGRSWYVADLLPTTDGNSFDRELAIRATAGRTVELFLPVLFGQYRTDYRFSFIVDSVRQIAWNAYSRPPWIPPSPQLPGVGPTREDNITAAIIVAGFAGYFWNMMTFKKTPVVE